MSSLHISLSKLRHIQRVAELRSFVRAADDLAITQSALTRSIQSVEKHFGILVFDRDRRGVRLTAIGKALIDRAAPLLREARDMERALFRMAGGEEGEVAFGLSPVVAKASLSHLLEDQLRVRPASRTRAFVRSTAALIELIRSEQIEFCATTLGSIEPTDDLAVRPIATISNMLAVATGHPLLETTSFAFEDISGFPLIASTYPVALEHHFSTLGIRYRPSVVTEDYGTLLHLTLNSQAVWLTSPIGCREAVDRGTIRALPVRSQALLSAVDVGIVSLSRRSMSPMARAVIDQIELLIDRAVSSDRLTIGAD